MSGSSPTTSGILHALGLVVFERSSEGFRAVGVPDPTFTARFPDAASDGIDLIEVFPFLESFLEQAESVWDHGGENRKSQPWIQRDGEGAEVELRAIAVTVDSRRLLLIDSSGVDGDERRILQLAREGRLAQEQLERTTRALEASEGRYRRLASELDDRVRARTADLRRLASQLVDAEREERRRIAIALHDRLGQSLAVVRLGLSSLHGGAGDRRLTEQLLGSLDRAIACTRDLTFELGSAVLYELGLAPALEELARRVAERADLEIEVDLEDPLPVSEAHAVLFYEAVRELLHNCEKHSGARGVKLRSTVEERDDTKFLVIAIEDDGRGFDHDASESGAGFGLHSLRERFEYAGGVCTVDSAPARGTRVELKLETECASSERRQSS